MLRKKIVRAAAVGPGVVGLAFATAIPASAEFMRTGPAECGRDQVVIASSTIGNTVHSTATGRIWNKGYRNGGATTYTPYSFVFYVEVEAPVIRSSNFRCA